MLLRRLPSQLEKLSSIDDRGQADRVTALPRPHAKHCSTVTHPVMSEIQLFKFTITPYSQI